MEHSTYHQASTSLTARANRRGRSVALVALFAVVATLLRIPGLSAYPMYDEAASWTFAHLPWVPFWKVMWNYEGYMVFYYIVLRAWVHLGDSEAILRGLSVLFGAATVIAVYDLGSRLFNRRTGLIGASLLSVHAFHILWSQQARSYALLSLLLVASASLLIAAVTALESQTMQLRIWAAYVGVATLACYSHVLAIFVLAAQWLWVATSARDRPSRRAFAALLMLGVAIAPMLLFVALKNQGQEAWVPSPTVRDVLDILSLIGGATGYAEATISPLLIATGTFCALGVYFGFRSAKRFRSGTTFLVFWLCLPPAALAVLSLIEPILVSRYVAMCVPAAVLLVAFALDRLLAFEDRAIRYAGTAAATLIGALYLWATFAQIQAVMRAANPFRDMSQHVLASEEPGDAAIFFTASAHMSFNYYASFAPQDERTNMPKIVIPDFGDTPSGRQPIPSVDEIRSATKGYRRVWLVLNTSSINLTAARQTAAPIIWFTLLERFDLAGKTQIGNFLICLFARR